MADRDFRQWLLLASAPQLQKSNYTEVECGLLDQEIYGQHKAGSV
jgi:hypothetical protein